MMSALYSLRPELEFSAQTQHDKSYVVVKDPGTVHSGLRVSHNPSGLTNSRR